MVWLGLHLHHETGSKKIINVLKSYGVCDNYGEIRKLTIAIAEEQLSKTIIDIFVPFTLSNVNILDSNTIIDAAINNFDLNEETLTGENTTHSLAMVLYQQTNTKVQSVILKKSQSKSSALNIALNDNILFCVPPTLRSVPHGNILEFFSRHTSNNKIIFSKKMLSLLIQHNCQWDIFNEIMIGKPVPAAKATYLHFIDASPANSFIIYMALVKYQNLLIICRKIICYC